MEKLMLTLWKPPQHSVEQSSKFIDFGKLDCILTSEYQLSA